MFTPVILVPEEKDSRGKGGKVVWGAVTHWRRGKDKQQGEEYWLFGGGPVFTSSFRNYIPVFFRKLTFHLTQSVVWVDWLYHSSSDVLISACASFPWTRWLLLRWALDPMRDVY